MNKHQKTIHNIIKNDINLKWITYRKLKIIIKNVTRMLNLNELVEYKDHLGDYEY